MSYLTVAEIESALITLNNMYPNLTKRLQPLNSTYEQRSSNALLIANPGFSCRPAFIFISGVHAREWGGPDILVYLAADLLEAYATNAGLAYGMKSFSAAAIKAIVDRCDIVVFPDVNPDGRAYSMAAVAGSDQAKWRKNRNPASSGGDPAKIGVDVNRNYNFLWDFTMKFAPNAPVATSTDPASDAFYGTGPFSEAESRNVQWLVDLFPNARYFVDIHSFSGDLLYTWGDAKDQTTDPSMSFMNSAWDGKRGSAGDVYGDYLPATRLAELKAAATVIHDGIAAVRGQDYVIEQSFALYASSGLSGVAVSGTSDDWTFSREFLDPGKGPLSSFVIEFNKVDDFFPPWSEMVNIIKDIDAGLIALADYARPTFVQVLLCRVGHFLRPILDVVRGMWHRVFPPELWGPYGPWSRAARLVEEAADRISLALRQLWQRRTR